MNNEITINEFIYALEQILGILKNPKYKSEIKMYHFSSSVPIEEKNNKFDFAWDNIDSEIVSGLFKINFVKLPKKYFCKFCNNPVIENYDMRTKNYQLMCITSDCLFCNVAVFDENRNKVFELYEHLQQTCLNSK